MQAIQTPTYQRAGVAGQRMRALVHLDARDDAGIAHHLGERHSRLGLLADGFVEQNRAGDVLAQTRRSQQHFAVRTRSEEHTSELQSLMRISYAVFCLKKKKKKTYQNVFT